jgi:sugar diacid utilization regulator
MMQQVIIMPQKYIFQIVVESYKIFANNTALLYKLSNEIRAKIDLLRKACDTVIRQAETAPFLNGGVSMQISLNIVLDVLQKYNHEIHIPSDNTLTFSKCLPLPDAPRELDGECIYVGGLAKALELCGDRSDICCICLRDRIQDDNETPEKLAGLVVVNENITQTSLISQVQDRFFKMSDWVFRMHDTLIHDGTMQEIVEMSAPVIGNYIAVSDSSLMLLANTKSIPCDDPICVALATHGYFPEETIQIFRKYDLFKTWEMADSIYIDECCEVAKYPTIHKIFKFGNLYFAHAVVTCNRNAITPSMMDLFKIFVDVLAVYIERAWEAKKACNHIYDTFLTDLIEGNVTSRNVIEERAQYVGIPLTGQFCLYQIICSDAVNLSIGKMLIEFSDLFPYLKFIRYQQRIVALNHLYARNIDEQIRAINENMEAFLEKYDAQCGVSLFFNNLIELPFSFRQSTLALKYIDRLYGHEMYKKIHSGEKARSRIHYFSSNYFYCLLGENEGNAELWYHSEYHGKLKKLYDYDQRHKSNHFQLLQLFLTNERSATITGNALNMHRNNVIYHVNRIEEMLGIDFGDPQARFMTQVSFALLELNGFQGE